MTYHKPVLLDESIKGLNINPNGIYVDATFGGGGHSKEIMKSLQEGCLFAFDQDDDAVKNTIVDNKFKLIKANFRYIKNFLKIEGISKIDGLIADLGISSYQIDVPERGFAYRYDSVMDMRMNIHSSLNAREVINSYSESDLAKVFYEYGEIKQSRRIAKKIIEHREEKNIHTTSDFINILEGLYPQRMRNKFLSRIFQAIRIEVNDEINALKDLLEDVAGLLNNKGRLVVISYHSLEDRLVKNLINKGNLSGFQEKDLYGRVNKDLDPINKKVIVPEEKECKENPRARSAKLRVAEKI
jgi:16S rRNA (cytosine1402-N4)-methyltransferase